MKPDPATYFEELADEIAQEAVQFVEVDGPAILNREPFSTPKPPEAQHQEWVEAMANPQALMERYQMLVSLYGPQKGELMLRQWDKKHAAMNSEMEQDNAGSIY